MIRTCKVTEKELPRVYLELMNGLLKLTEGEIALTAKIIEKYRMYGSQGLREPFLSKFVFSTEERRSMAASLGKLSNQSLSNKLNQLVNKRVLTATGNSYTLDRTLLPEAEVTFKFILVDEKPRKDIQKSIEGDGTD
ncbi:hypothetical protein [Tenacibaculum sp.]|uniref:hypothetical protein n=1 Tax=Tenacibaculum sp. TaxID=1906242 RepID=UPI003D0EF970